MHDVVVASAGEQQAPGEHVPRGAWPNVGEPNIDREELVSNNATEHLVSHRPA
ncbi:hypothetical protein [Burkholderia cepacia]|uniref:hypothetical protein n=1 Tax=Burkholderia cepacia TaxID=292 RepID=UPI002ABDAC95|nr:hypothetical protein [Burkholderia cepacia]